MKRVFQVSEIESLCKDLKNALEQCKDHISAMRECADEAESAINAVPWEVRNSGALTAVGDLRSALKTDRIDDALEKIENCRVRACELIPAADEEYGTQTEELVDMASQVRSLMEEMREFLIGTPLNTDYSVFASTFREIQAKWNQVTEGVEAGVEKILGYVKGAELTCQIFSKDPVNLSTGNLIYDREDLKIEGRERFVFRRFYNAINRRKGALGKDWNHNYEVRIAFEDGEAVLFREDGREERFFREGERYLPLFASEGELRKTEEGYEYVTRGQKRYWFDREGRCQYTKELSGSRIQFQYEEENPFRLKKVEKTTGESFVLNYGEDGELTSVEDHTGRKVSYRYEKGMLSSAVAPDGGEFRYRYTPQGKLESVENPRGILTVENSFDEKDRTILQKFPDGTQMSYAYDEDKKSVELTERNGSRIKYIHDEKYRDIKHIYSNGEERFEYNGNNQKTLHVDRLGNKTQYAYDPSGNLTRVIDALGNQVEIRYGEYNQPTQITINGKEKLKGEYDEDARLTAMRDALGNQTRIQYNRSGWPKTINWPDGSKVDIYYDGRGNITEIRDAWGNTTRYSYDELNRMTESIDGNGNHTRYTYDVMGNVTKIENAEGNSQYYEYNASGKVTKVTDFDGHSIQREYNVLNRPSKITDKLGRETLLTYDSMWNLARVTTPDGAKTTYIYNEHNLLSRMKYADGAVVRYTYDANGNRIGEEDENGAKTTFVYDALNRVIEVKGEEGVHYAYEYDGEGNLIRATDALGNTVEMEYDGNGNLIRETNPLGESRSYTYTALGDIETITDESGRETRYTYLPGGRLEGVLHPDGTKESFTYDGNGNLKSHTLTTGFVLTYTYDSMDRIIEIRGSEGESKKYSYDVLGNVTSMTDGLGNTTRYEYSLSGQLTKVIDALGNETEYRYDACDRLVEIQQYGEEGSLEESEESVSSIDAEWMEAERRNGRNRTCQVTRYLRDLRGQVTEVIDAIGQREEYTYDRKGQLLSKLDKEGYLTRYAYTKQGDVARIQYADGREVKLSYNPLRQLTLIEDWIGSTKITPDALGRARKVVYPDGREVSYTYGKSGERTSITYPDGRSVFYGYDEQIRLSELKEGDRITAYTYDQLGRLAGKQFPNGTKTSYAYDSKDQLTELVHMDKEGVLDRYTYLYDLTGNKTGITKERRGLKEESGAYTYGYDALGRLSQIQKDGKLQTRYGYDAFSNRILKEEGTEKTTYRHNALNQLIAEEREGLEKLYDYDRRGNLTRITENGQTMHQYVYGTLNRLEMAVDQAGKAARYTYNGLGHRVGKQEGNIRKEQLNPLNPQSRIDAEIGNIKQIRYTIDLTKQYHNLLMREEEQRTQTYFWDGTVTAYEEDGRRGYYLQDELGSPLRIEDELGAIKESYGYGAFGEDLYGNQGEIQPFGYTGYQRDSVAGTYFAQAREYRPEIARFVERDVIKGFTGYPFSLNNYSYCYNSPLILVDDNGLLAHLLVGAVVGAVVNTAISVGTSLMTGEEVTFSQIFSSALGGAVTGAITAGIGNPKLAQTVGSVAGGAVERGIKGFIEKDSLGNVVKDIAVGAVADVGLAAVGGCLKNSSKVTEMTDYFKNTKIGAKIFGSKNAYDDEITRLRTAWKQDKTILKPNKGVYANGVIGLTGINVTETISDMQASYMPGMDIKAELENILNKVIEEGMEVAKDIQQMQEYARQTLEKMLKTITNEELKTVLCVE